MRSRNIKPDFFISDQVTECSLGARLLFIGLLCYSDRDGRFEWRPKRIRASVFPADSIVDSIVDINVMLDELQRVKLVNRYMVKDKEYGEIPNFIKHQRPHQREARSVIPPGPQSEPKSYLEPSKDEPKNSQGESKDEPKCDQGVRNEERGMRNEECGVIHSTSNEDSSVRGVEDDKSKKKSKKKINFPEAVLEILDDLNDLMKLEGRYRFDSEAHKKHIHARIKDGYTKKQLFILNRWVVETWPGTPRAKHMNPVTMFGRVTNFPGYAVASKQWFDERKSGIVTTDKGPKTRFQQTMENNESVVSQMLEEIRGGDEETEEC